MTMWIRLSAEGDGNVMTTFYSVLVIGSPKGYTFAPLVNMLESNENASRQKLSMDKTTMLFSQNTRAIVKEHIQ
jgi:hypothetical protein